MASLCLTYSSWNVQPSLWQSLCLCLSLHIVLYFGFSWPPTSHLCTLKHTHTHTHFSNTDSSISISKFKVCIYLTAVNCIITDMVVLTLRWTQNSWDTLTSLWATHSANTHNSSLHALSEPLTLSLSLTHTHTHTLKLTQKHPLGKCDLVC